MSTNDLTGTVIATAVAMPAVAALAVGLRFYARGRLIRALGYEDLSIFVALVFSIVSTAWVIKEALYGLGRHRDTVSASNMTLYLQAAYFMGLFYNLSLCFTKISILLLYLRILVTFDYIRKATYITLAIVVIYNLWAFAVYFAMCIPLARAWDHNVKGSCRGATTWWAVASLHIITDFMIFLLPIPVVTTMTIPRRQKAGLLLAFAMGFFVCLVSLLRTLWLRDRVNSKDTTWDLVTIANWSIAEINVAILCACVPTLKPLLKKMDPWMHRLFPRHWTQDNNNNNEATSSSRPLTIGSIPLRVLGVEQGGRVNAGRPIEGQGVTERDREGGEALTLTLAVGVGATGNRDDMNSRKGLLVEAKSDRDLEAGSITTGDDSEKK